MLYRDIIAVCSEIHTERRNKLYGRLSAQCRRDLVLKMAVRIPATWRQRFEGLIVAVIFRRLSEIVAVFPVCSLGTHCCREGCHGRVTWYSYTQKITFCGRYVTAIFVAVSAVGITPVRAGTHYPHVTWAHVMLRVQLGCERRFNTEFYDADSHFCHSAYVTWSHVELWSAHAPARLSHFCCRAHFVRRDQRVECSAQLWLSRLTDRWQSSFTSLPNHISLLMGSYRRISAKYWVLQVAQNTQTHKACRLWSLNL